MKNILTDYIACFEDYIQKSRQLCIVVLDEALRIRTTNQCFRDIMGTMAPLEGEDFKALLLPESRHILPLDNASASLTIPLNLNTKNAGVLSLECRIYKQEEAHLILGGRILHTNQRILQKISMMNEEMVNLTRKLAIKNKALEDAQSKIKVLGGIIPICMHCKGIRDDKGYWNKLEKFITENSEAQFSHSICDACMEKLYPEDADENA